MNVEPLVKMANDVSAFFASESGAAAPQTVANHFKRFWEPRMRKQIIEHWRNGGAGLSEISKAAVAVIAEEAAGRGS
jgi:formate dehydrogenase subunit delta